MRQRKPLAALGLAGVALALFTLAAPGGQPRGKAGDKGKSGHPHHEMFERCAKACNDCQRICDTCATHCVHLLAQGQKEYMKMLRTCQDCADFCATTAQIVSRHGPFAALICQSCAEACKRCDEACDQFKDDPMMRQCAEECRRCERACREMVQHVGQQTGKRESK
ncbi:MAG: four-helix bundle copper-binding protein [Gemmataceae bacterium]|nr:four-helix bundle copper-binding protein [Gemmataceae bacterium]